MMLAYDKPATKVPKWFPEFKANLPRMEGKTVVITGTTSGTGFIAANTLAELGATLILLNRNSNRAETALKKLQNKHPEAKIEAVECDLMDFKSVREASSKVNSRCPQGIDVLCNNAGVMALEDQATKDGYDVQMQTNHLSHFLLTSLLLPSLKIAAKVNGEARIVNHTSDARNWPPMKLDAKYLQKNGGNLGGNGSSMIFAGARWKRYQQSKLANTVFTYALKDQLESSNSNIKVLVAHPGLSATNLQTTTVSDGGMGSWFATFFMMFSQSPEDGAMGIIQCMCAKDVKSGDFYAPYYMAFGPVAKISPDSKSTHPKSKELLWTESEKAVGKFLISKL